MTREDRKEYLFEKVLGGLQLIQICEGMIKVNLGWRRVFYEEQLEKHRKKTDKSIQALTMENP